MKRKPSAGIPLFIMTLILTAFLVCWSVIAVRYMKGFELTVSCAACLLLLLVISVLWYILIGSLRKKENYFLHDFKKKTDIPVDELTYDIIDERLTRYLSVVIAATKKTMINTFISKHFESGIPPTFKLIVTPFYFIKFAEQEGESGWKNFLTAPKEETDYMENALFGIGADEIARKLQYFRATYENSSVPVKEYFEQELDSLKELLLTYIKDNIEKYK